jgi:uncharacterized BrkB/YihY/UPF0761 family membrane protein
MLRTIFTIGIIAIVGLFVLRLAFGILGGLFGILFWLISISIPILILGAIIYLVLKVFAPDTARELRSKFGGQ